MAPLVGRKIISNSSNLILSGRLGLNMIKKLTKIGAPNGSQVAYSCSFSLWEISVK
jgi:hypothetical protein